MDNIEDKGMNAVRSQNFRHRIVDLSLSLNAEHQIIFTTPMIAPDLDESDFIVGEHYVFANKSLRVGHNAGSAGSQRRLSRSD
jgi:hypothetical protein